MRELKSYRDPYHGYKRSPAMFGPYRNPMRYMRRLGLAYILIAVLLLIGVI